MRRDAIVLIAVVLAVALMITTAVVWSRKPDGAAAAANSTSADGLAADVKGKDAPDFSLKSLDGKEVKLSDFRGKAVLLNFWATWCGPCKIEMPWFQELQKKYGPQGLQVLGVAMDDTSPEVVGKFAKQTGVDYLIVMGKEAVGEQYGGVQFLPTTFYIDRQGKVVDRAFGLLSYSEIEGNIKKALETKAAGVAEAR
jgi:thiol-disulfide isomerase/thioredoxin